MHQSILCQRHSAKHRNAPCHHQLLQLQLPQTCRHAGALAARAARNSGDWQNPNQDSSREQQEVVNSEHRKLPAPAQSDAQDALSAAAGELQSSLGLLKDAAGAAFIPGYRPESTSKSSSSVSKRSSRHRPALKSYSSLVNAAAIADDTRITSEASGVQSIPERSRLLTGRFISDMQANTSNRKSQPPFDAKLAALQFELQRAEATQQEQQQQRHKQQPVQDPAGGRVIDVVPEVADAAKQYVGSPVNYVAAASTSAAEETAAAAAAAAATTAESGNSSASMAANSADRRDTFPATAQMLVIATWAVFLLQWWPALPQLWLTLKHAGVLQALATLLFAYPDTPVTQALCLDLTKVQAGSLASLLTSGLLHSGLAATWLCTRALYDSARWIDIGSGSMELLATYSLCSLCASLAHMVAGTTMVSVAGSGATLGVYVAWTILAVQHLKNDLPSGELYVRLVLVLLLNVGLGLIQPAIGMASIVGGALGGVLAVKVAPLATASKWGVAVPCLVVLFALRMVIDAVKVLLLAMVPVVVAVAQGMLGVVQAVRRL